MVLKISDIDVKYGNQVVLHDISHVFEPGWTHIVGPNGAGKSTLLKVMAGLLKPDSGSVMLDECDLQRMHGLDRASRIAYVPQRLEAVPALTVAEFVAQGCYAWQRMENIESAAMKNRALNALQTLGIDTFAERRMDKLSGGEVQLCVLASAVAQNAEIILLDEPTTGLDICHVQRFCHALEDLKTKGKIIISTTHDLQLAARHADAFVLLKNGTCQFACKNMPDTSIWCKVFDVTADCDEIRSLQLASQTQSITATITPIQTVTPAEENSKKYRRVAAICALIASFICLAAPFIGATTLLPWEDSTGWHVFWSLRVPRVVWGGICGAVLAVVGAVLQALFQNPLATPYTLGVASGASLGAMAAIQLGVSGILGVPAAACGGGLLVMFAVLAIASHYGLRQPIYCLMAGVAASMFCSAFGMVIQAFATPLTAQQMMRWQLGGLEVVGYSEFAVLPIIVLAAIYLCCQAQPLNLLSVDSELAASRGVSVEKTRILALLSAGVATSIVVSVCGPIGFVGLMIPNALRRLLGADLKRILPLSAAIGASFVMFADTLSRLIERIAWIPVGVVTAMIGAPIFMIAILKK